MRVTCKISHTFLRDMHWWKKKGGILKAFAFALLPMVDGN